ncbi:MAG TPA: protein phosphatase 2C domain-containing protein [Candidatus Nitrosotenuis sp.]|nr:protein phosphatase 2C domain-containing protein [Candidatus Nitrosotenuis sp.]
MKCPDCGSENPGGSQFCEDCGALLASSSEGGLAVATLEGPLGPGELVGQRYRIERVLEAGRVNRYRAFDLTLDEAPVLLEEQVDSAGQDPLERQWQVLRDLEDPALWKPSERFEVQGRKYLVGPLPGEVTLEEHLAGGQPLPPLEVADLGMALARGLGVLHRAGWLHRSLSPAAVWLTAQGDPVLGDFDRLQPAGEPSQEYSVIEGFSAPEDYGVEGGTPDQRSDLFSLGAVLYFCLTGERRRTESRETFFSFPRPRLPGAEPLVDVVMRCLEREPGRRYASASELQAALDEAAQAVEGGGAQPTPAAAVEAAPGEPTSIVRGTADYEVAMLTHVGVVRSVNQDACLELSFSAWEKDAHIPGHLVLVCDGMGGEAEGDKAASLAIRTVAQEVLERFLAPHTGTETALLLPGDPLGRNGEILRRALERANRVIHQYASGHPGRRGMGCTMSAALLEGDLVVVAHVGDTRVLRIGAELDQITTDHSLVGKLVQMGRLTREEARVSPQRSIIYKALGTNPEVEVDLYHRRLAPGEYLLLASDGVWEYYSDEELLSYFRGGGAPAEIASRLVQTCLARGADDNATAVVVRYRGPDRS